MRVAIGSLFLIAQPLLVNNVHSQEVAAPDPLVTEKARATSAPSESLDAVTVTARKKSERLQDVPLAVTAITGQTLEDTSSTNIRDVVNLTPGVTITTGGAESNVNITIRGIADLSGGAGDPNVAVFIDGVYQSNRSAISIGLLDLLRIEVIKGPVSALYGRNAYGGVINYVTTPPQVQPEAAAAFTYGDYGTRNAKISLGGALGSPALLGRLVYAHEEFGGTFRDSVNGQHAGGYRKDDVLGRLTAKPTDLFTIDGSFYYGDDFFDNPPEAYENNNCGPRTAATSVTPGQFTQFCGQFNTHKNPVEVTQINPASGSAGNQRRVYADSIKLAYDLQVADVSALFGYDKVTQQRLADFTAHRGGIPYLGSNGTIYNLSSYFGSNTNNEDGSLDLRLASKQNQPLRGAVGLYLYRAKTTSTTIFGIDGSPVPSNVAFAYAFAQRFRTSNGEPSTTAVSLANQTDRIVSPFASGEYDILPALTASVEGRHTLQKKTQDIVRNNNFPNVDHPLGAAGTVASDFAFNNYRGSLRYKLGPDQMVYVSAADGTKSGGFNLRATIASEVAFQPETNNTFEVGTRLGFFDNKALVGISLFKVKAKNVQISGTSDDPTNLGLVTKNFAKAESDGADIDLSVVPLRGLVLTTGVGLANPKLQAGTYDFSNGALCLTIASCASRVVTIQTPQGPRTVVDLAGLQSPRASKVTVSVGAQYNGQITDDMGYFARVDYRRESKQFELPIQINSIAPRNVINLNAGLTGDHYRLTAYVKNLTNNSTPEIASSQGTVNNGVAPWVAILPDGRTFGLTAEVRY